MNKKKEFKADKFWSLAMARIDSMDKEEDILSQDLTLIFFSELAQKVKHGELINININGEVRSGKSTVAPTIAVEIKESIKKYYGLDRPMSNKNITRDQNEYSRLVKRRPIEFKHECDVIDEWAEMELTGYNATIEQKYLKQFSDVQAGRYYHRIGCSPTNVTDENSKILLSVVPGGRTNGKTLCLLYYRLNRAGITDNVLLGHVVIDVQKTLDAPWYQDYLKKKEEKWDLMNRHNVKSPRELEYAKIILNTFQRIREDAEIGLTNKKHIKSDLQAEADKLGVWFSILGDKDILETLEGLAEKQHLYTKFKDQLLNPKLDERKRKRIQKLVERTEKRLKEVLKRQAQLSQLWEDYQII